MQNFDTYTFKINFVLSVLLLIVGVGVLANYKSARYIGTISMLLTSLLIHNPFANGLSDDKLKKINFILFP